MRPADLDGARVGVVSAQSSMARQGADLLMNVLGQRHYLGSITLFNVDDAAHAEVIDKIRTACDVAVVSMVEDESTLGLVDLGGLLERAGIPCVVIVTQHQHQAAVAQATTLPTTVPLVALPDGGVESLGIAGPVLGQVENALTSTPPGDTAAETPPPAGSAFECTC